VTPRTFARPDVLEAYSPAMLGRVAASRPQLAAYRSAVAAFNAAPNETGFVIPDRSGQIAADLDWLGEVDRQPALFAAALRSVDVLRWSGSPLTFSLALLREAWGLVGDERLRAVLSQLADARMAEMTELLRGAGELTPEQFAERADDLAEAFAWVADASVDRPEILEAVFGDWDAAQLRGLLANLSRYASASDRGFGLGAREPDEVERLLSPVARALGAAIDHGVLDAPVVAALVGDVCPAAFDGFDDPAFHQTQGRQLLLGHAADLPAGIVAGLAHHAITAEPVVARLFAAELGGTEGFHTTPATLYLDHRYAASLDELLGDARGPFVQPATTYALLAVDGWSAGANEAAFAFAADVHPSLVYERLVAADGIDGLVAQRILASGLGRYALRSADPTVLDRASTALFGLADAHAAAGHGRWYSMDPGMRRALAMTIASHPHTLQELAEGSTWQKVGGPLLVELMRDDAAAASLYQGARSFQVDRLAQRFAEQVGPDGAVSSQTPHMYPTNLLADVARLYESLDGLADEAGAGDELRGDIVSGTTNLLLGLVPKVPVREVVQGGGVLIDVVRLESELEALGEDRQERFARRHGAALTLLAHVHLAHPEVIDRHLPGEQQAALRDAMDLEDPVAREEALAELWQYGAAPGSEGVAIPRDNEVRVLIEWMVNQTS
jgi:hypothetical protein